MKKMPPKKSLKEKIKKIKMIILDVDGVLTDGGLMIGHNGFEYMKFNVQDGAGIVMAQKVGYRFALITGRNTAIVDRRAEILHIADVFQNRFFKIETYEEVIKKYHLKDEEVCYIGDDLLDLPILERVGFSSAPANAVDDVKEKVDYVTVRKGGKGAVREMIDLILNLTGKKEKLIQAIRHQTIPEVKLS